MATKYWDDYVLDEVMESSGRTVENADIRLFIGATDASHPAHLDAEYAKTHPFGKVVAPGALLIGMVDGFAIEVLLGKSVKMAHYGYDRIRFLKPVGVGDTIHMKARVIELREKSLEFGLLKLQYDVLNERDDLVAVVIDLQMMERRPAA